MTRPGSPFGSTTRFIALALALGLAGAVAACGGNNDDGDSQPIDLPDRVAGLPAGVNVHIEHDRITRVFGRAILTGTSPEAVSSEFVSAHSGAFGVRAADLHRTGAATGAQQVMYDPRTGAHKFSLITYEQRSNDVRVFDADVRLLVANRAGSPLTLVASSLRDLDGYSSRSASEIVAAAQLTDYRDTSSAAVGPMLTSFTQLEAVIWAGLDRTLPPVEAVTFVANNLDQRDVELHQWRFVVAVATGEVLHKENLIHTDVSGTITGTATTGTGAMECNPTASRPMPYAEVTSSTGGTTFTDIDGAFSLSDNSGGPITLTSQIRGQWFFVDNYTGTQESLDQLVAPDGVAAFVHNAADDTGDVRAQVNLYVEANAIRDWTVRNSPAYPVIPTQTDFPVYANRVDGYCPGNAWYDPSDQSINFCTQGSIPDADFPNTSFASIIHHEYGHHIVEMGGSGQGAYGEGMSDVVAMLYSDDPNLGFGFFLNDCANPLRSADNTCQYAQFGCSTCGSEAHDCGRLISGAVWSARNELLQTEPADYLDILSALAVNSVMLHGGWDITPQIAIDFLVLDDDDANLDNGTPHRSEICAGFDAHGLTCPELANSLTVVAPSGIDEDAGPFAGIATVSVDAAPSADLVVNLSSSDLGELQVPATVTITAGETSTTFALAAIDDAILDGSQLVTVFASSSEAAPGATTLFVHDSETASIAIVVPASATEGDGVLAGAGTVTISAPAGDDVSIQLGSSLPSEVTVPVSVTVAAGETVATFDLSVMDDAAIDGPQTATITGSVIGWTPGAADIEIDDDENTDLAVFVPASVGEGVGVLVGAGIVQISGTLAADLVVQLVSSDLAIVTVPATATIPAGAVVGQFDITVVDDTVIESTQSAMITASTIGFAGANATIEVRDDDVHHFTIAPIASPATAGEQLAVQITAVSDSEQTITDFNGNVTLSVAGDSGSHAVVPTSAVLANGAWQGTIIINAVDTGVILTAVAAGGAQGMSNSFELRAGAVAGFDLAPVASPQYSGTPFGVVVTAVDANGYTVIDFGGPANLSSRSAASTSIVITEASLAATDAVEIQNISTALIDTSGWRVVVSDSYTDPQSANATSWSLPAQIGPGQVLYSTDNTLDEYFGANIRWSDGLPGWAMIVDDLLNVVDFVAWGWDASDIAAMAPSVDGISVPVVDAFEGVGVDDSGAGSIQRAGNEDRNVATDFGWATASLGGENTALVSPFLAGVTGVSPSQTEVFTAGQWTGAVTFSGESLTAVLLVDDGAGRFGVSNTFELAVALVCAAQPCDNGGACIPDGNTYTCECAAGWQGDNCEDDIDECTANTDDCDVNATCSNTDGSYTCDCNPGYSRDGTTCVEVCGDGQVGPSEECDDGDDNSDVVTDACRTDCTSAGCGDGIIDSGETCDDGVANSDEIADACRTNCAVASCGDGALDDGEVCDDGTANSDETADACRTTCAAAFCGDGVADTGEACDDGAANSNQTADACRDDCTSAGCGDGVIDDGEACDEGAANVDDVCGQCNTTCEISQDTGGCSASGSPRGAAGLALMLAVVGLLGRRRRRRRRCED